MFGVCGNIGLDFFSVFGSPSALLRFAASENRFIALFCCVVDLDVDESGFNRCSVFATKLCVPSSMGGRRE